MTTGQGAHHLGSSLAPVTDQSLSAGASCAPSLPAHAAVVTTRLAQNCCRFAQTALQQESHWLAPLRLVGVKMPRVCHARHAWRRRPWLHTVVAVWGSGAGLYPHECGRSSVATASRLPWIAPERWLAHVARMLPKQLTTGLQVSPSLTAAGVEEISPALALVLASIGRCVDGHQSG
jgi:hypothetical protein